MAKMRFVGMPEHLEADVRALHEDNHQTWWKLDPGWFKDNETIIAIDETLHEYPQVVGYSSYKVRDENVGKMLFLRDTCVAKSHRGRGLAKEFMSRRIEIARDRRITWVGGATQSNNPAMLKLLRDFGFQQVGLYPAGLDGNSDQVLFLLRLGE